MKSFEPKHMPVLTEYVILGVTISLGLTLKDNKQVDEFFDCVKDRCLAQGLSEADVLDTLSNLRNGIEIAVDGR